MSLAKSVLFLSGFLALVAVYLHYTIDVEKQKEYSLVALFKTLEIMSYFDSWLCYIDMHGLRNTGEALFAGYVFRNVNTSGLIIDVKQFNGVEVIMFDIIQHEKKRPAIVYIHGGGWSYSSPRLYASLTGNLARRLNTIVLSVDYRKAPMHPYPAAFNDILAAVKYLFLNAEQFDIDPDRVAIMGDSAGGNLAVAVTYHLSEERLRNKDTHIPKLLVPLCPVMQIADLRLPSMLDNVDDIMITQRKVAKSICKYSFGIMSDWDLIECADLVTSNSHLNEEAITIVKHNMDWTKYLRGESYDGHGASHFNNNNVGNKFTERLSQLALDPRISPLSALNDSQIKLLPSMFVFGASKDPLRDDAKLFAVRATIVGNFVLYNEIDFYHDPFMLSTFGLLAGLKSLDILEATFRENSIL